MATTIQVILQQDLKNLGKSGELVRVRPGYARNYLIPRSLATPATVHNVKQLEHEQRISAAKAAKIRAEATGVADKAMVIDYKDPQALKYFISERGKVVPRRISGNCALHQRKVTLAIKRARQIALLPFTVTA